MPIMPPGEQWCCRSGAWALLAGRVLPWALSGRRLHGDVLEIGCGGGAMAAAAVRRDPGIRLIACDLDPAMVAATARRLAGRAGRASAAGSATAGSTAAGSATAQLADSTSLPFADASFDAVLSSLMLHHVGDWERAVTEAARVLRPGGEFLGYDLVDGRLNRLVHRADGIAGLRAITEATLRDALDAAGFAAPRLRRDPARLTLRWIAEKR